jgi:subtilisin family serine protease
MKRSLTAYVLLATALSFVAASLPLLGQTRYIVGTRAAAPSSSFRMIQSDEARRLRNVRDLENVDGFAATLTAEEAEALRHSPNVRYVSPVAERHLNDAPVAPAAPNSSRKPVAEGSPYTGAQTVAYGIDLVHARALWPVTKGKGIVHVVVFDTGIDMHHPELMKAYAGGYNTFDAAAAPWDDNRHGTHVSGIIAAEDNNAGVVGVAPEVELWMVKILDGNGRGTDENVIAAIDWTLKKKKETGGNYIVSMSFGSDAPTDPEAEAFRKLVAAGVLPVAAAGNSGFARVDWPGAYPGVFSVGAVDVNSAPAGFSSYGPGLGVVAPGVDVLSTAPYGSIPSASGKVSTGLTVTAAAIVGSRRGELTAAYVNCGLGRPEDFPAAVAGKIALMQRGLNIPFAEKVRNAVAAGAIGAVIFNADGSEAYQNWTLIRPDCGPTECVPYADDVTFNWPIAIALPTDEGKKLLPFAGTTQTITISEWDDSYLKMSGTSMATPHVSGVAALLWAMTPAATATDVRNAIALGAHDIGAPGNDLVTGFGLLDAQEAVKYLNPGAIGGHPSVPPTTPRRHPSHP